MPSQTIGGTVYGSYDMNPDLVEVMTWKIGTHTEANLMNLKLLNLMEIQYLDYVDDLLRNQGQSQTTSHHSSSISSSPIIPNLLDEIDDLSQDEGSSQSTSGPASSSRCSTPNVLRTIVHNHANGSDIEVSSQSSSRPSTSRSNTPLHNSLLDYVDDLSDIDEENNPPVSQSTSRSSTPLANNENFDEESR